MRAQSHIVPDAGPEPLWWAGTRIDFLAVTLTLFAFLLWGGDVTADIPPLPEGNTGIAAAYPEDVGIASAPGVLFTDDFEGSAKVAALNAKWNAGVMHQVRIATEPGLTHSGGCALEFTVPKQADEMSNQVMRHLVPKQDLLFMRYYTKFQAGFEEIGSSHNGSSISGGYYDANGDATPGVGANGRNKFFVSTEVGRDSAKDALPGRLNTYIYWPNQGDVWGDHFYPTGEVRPFSSTRSGAVTFGSDFVARPEVVPPVDKWFCCEVMVKLNATGKLDGRIGTWMDGKLVADYVNLRFRDVASLQIDRVGLDLHIKSNTVRRNKKWYDDVVVATSYIGPMVSNSKGNDTSRLPPAKR